MAEVFLSTLPPANHARARSCLCARSRRTLSQSILEILETITIVIVSKISKMDCDTDT
jgi:hypothetical protein